MTREPARTTCPDPETLAAFAEGRLRLSAADEVESHLADCPGCREVWIEVRTLEAGAASAMPSPGAQSRHRRRYFIPGALAVAATVALTVWLVGPWNRAPLRDLVAAVGADRFAEGRLAGGFAWGPAPASARGRDLGSEIPDVQIAAGRIANAVRQDRSAGALNAYGVSLLALGRPVDAVRALEEAAEVAPASADVWSNLAAALVARHAFEGRSADLAQALDAADRALSITPGPEALFNRALALQLLGLRDAAIEAWEAYLLADPDSPWAAEVRNRIEALRRASSDLGSRIDHQDLRERLFDELLPAWAAATRPASSAFADVEEAGRALEASADALARDTLAAVATAERRGERVLADLRAAHVRYGEGRRAYRADRFQEAMAALAEAERLGRAAGSPIDGMAALYQAIITYRRGDGDGAFARLRTVHAAARQRQYFALSGRAAWLLGQIDSQRLEHQQPMAYYEDASRAFEAAAEPRNQAAVEGLRASRLDFVGDVQNAWARRVAALAGGARQGDVLAAAQSAQRLGLVHAAASLQHIAEEMATAEGRDAGRADALRSRARTFVKMGRRSDAQALLLEARRIVEAHPEQGWNALRAEIDLADAEAAAAEDADAAIEAAGRAVEYFVGAARPLRAPEALLARARLHRAQGAGNLARDDLRAAIGLLDSQRSAVPSGALRAMAGEVVQKVIDELIDLELEAQRFDEAFAAAEAFRGFDVRATAGAMPRRLPADIAGTLPTHVAVVVYVVTDGRTVAWVLQRDGAHMFDAGLGRRDLQRLTGGGEGLSDAGVTAELSSRLMAPVLSRVEAGTTLIVVPDGPIHRVAFAGLAGRGDRYLIEDHPVVFAMSASVARDAALTGSAPGARPASVVAVGNPEFSRDEHPDLPTLPWAAAEAAAVAKHYAVSHVLTGRGATRIALLDRIAQAEVVHLAAHGLVNAVNPGESAVVLADGTLTAGTIARLELPRVRAVVLAACESATGQITRAEGPIGLAWGFLQAGVPWVVAGWGPVSDRPAETLFRVFHRELSATGDPVGALRTAQMTLLSSDDALFRDPRNWARVVVYSGVQAPGDAPRPKGDGE